MSDPQVRESEPRLGPECLAYVGKILEIRFKCWPPWTQVTGADIIEYPDMLEMENLMAEVVPTDFFAQKDVPIRGLRGKITSPGSRFAGYYIIAVAGIPGEVSNFTDNVCTWRCWLSEKEIPAPTKSFRQVRNHDVDMIAGTCKIFDSTCEQQKKD